MDILSEAVDLINNGKSFENNGKFYRVTSINMHHDTSPLGESYSITIEQSPG